jgi:hypothetical protein
MAAGDRTEKRLDGPAEMPTSNDTLATVPASRQWTLKQVVFTNTGGAEALIYLAIGSAATASNRVLSALPIAAYDTIVWDTALVLEAAETLQGFADRAGVNCTVMGWEKEV